jgi:hypothetical protein
VVHADRVSTKETYAVKETQAVEHGLEVAVIGMQRQFGKNFVRFACSGLG